MTLGTFKRFRLRSQVEARRRAYSGAPAAAGGDARAAGGAPEPASAPNGAPGAPPQDPELAAIWAAVQRLARVVENDHSHRLERIERDLKWVMRLMTLALAAIFGAAAGDLLPK